MVALRTKLLEADIKESDLINRYTYFLRKLLPQTAPQKKRQHHLQTGPRNIIVMLDIAETLQRLPIAQQTEPPFVVERALVRMCRNFGLAAVAKMPIRPFLMMMCKGSLKTRVPN